jgi:hypothetical protein
LQLIAQRSVSAFSPCSANLPGENRDNRPSIKNTKICKFIESLPDHPLCI